MAMSLRDLAVETFVPMLQTLSRLLEKGEVHARAVKVDPASLVLGRLAEDMYPLTMQVFLACHHAEETSARLLGRDAPHLGLDPSAPQTIASLRARIALTVASLEEIPASEYDGAEARAIRIELTNGLVMNLRGDQLVRDWALPHFYFHVVTAYGILRNAGVPLGKQDYLAHIGRYIGHAAA